MQYRFSVNSGTLSKYCMSEKSCPFMTVSLLIESVVNAHIYSFAREYKYCMSKKSWPILYGKLLYKKGQDFLSIRYWMATQNMSRTHEEKKE